MLAKKKLILGLSLAGGGLVVAGAVTAAVVLTLPDSDDSAVKQATAVQTIKASAEDYKATPVEGDVYKYQGDDSGADDGVNKVVSDNDTAVIYAPNLAFPLALAKAKLPVLPNGSTYLDRPIVRVVYQNLTDSQVWNKLVYTRQGKAVVLQYPTQAVPQNVKDGDRLVISYPVLNSDKSSSAQSYEVSFVLAKQADPNQGVDQVVSSSEAVVGELADYYKLGVLTGKLPDVNTGYKTWAPTNKYTVQRANGGSAAYTPGVYVSQGDTIWTNYVAEKIDPTSNLQPYYCKVSYDVYDQGISLSQLANGLIGAVRNVPVKPNGGKLTTTELEDKAKLEFGGVSQLWTLAVKTSVAQGDNAPPGKSTVAADSTDLQQGSLVTITFEGTPTGFNANSSAKIDFQVIYVVVSNTAQARADVTYGTASLLAEELKKVQPPEQWPDRAPAGNPVITWDDPTKAYQVGAKGEVVFTIEVKQGYVGQPYHVTHPFVLVAPTQKSRYTVTDQTTWIAGVSTKDNAPLPLDPGYTQYRLVSRTFKASSASDSAPETNVLASPLSANSEGVVTSTYLVSGPELNDYAITVHSFTRVFVLKQNSNVVEGYAVVLPGQKLLDTKRLPILSSAYDDVWLPNRYYSENKLGELHEITATDAANLGDRDRLVIEYSAQSKNKASPSFVYRLHLVKHFEVVTTRLDEKSELWDDLSYALTLSATYVLYDPVVWQKGVSFSDSATIPLDEHYMNPTLIKRRFYKERAGSTPYNDSVDILSRENALKLVTQKGYVYSVYAFTSIEPDKDPYVVQVVSEVA